MQIRKYFNKILQKCFSTIALAGTLVCVKADWAAKTTGHCSGEAASDGRPHHQDANWTTSQSCYVMDSSWKWQESRAANKDMAVHIQRRPCGQRSRLEQRPGGGYRQAQMANSCCPLS